MIKETVYLDGLKVVALENELVDNILLPQKRVQGQMEFHSDHNHR